jgi:hypothetical protein
LDFIEPTNTFSAKVSEACSETGIAILIASSPQWTSLTDAGAERARGTISTNKVRIQADFIKTLLYRVLILSSHNLSLLFII